MNYNNSELMNIKNYVQSEADLGRRVLCLYRVSTNKQASYDEHGDVDIPMQRNVCRDFIKRQEWTLVHEEVEDGVSGHKVRASKRDGKQNIKELVATKKFDILLVFLFDRIGRISDETPFVVEWFINNGIRVWSAKEGEQRLDNHTDKLTNYIRYWQSDGESIKTSIRTSEGLALLVKDGHYKGGSPPYGYTLVKSGRLDKKKNEKKNLAVLPEEAAIIRKIFDLYVTYGYGVHKIANTLTAERIKTRAGKNFHHASINNMIRNLTYTGVLRSGKSRSDVIEEIQIISPAVYEQAQRIMEKRRTDAADSRTYPMNVNSRCLLNGKVYCADCGSRLVVATNGRYIYENGVRLKRLRYICYGKTRKQTDCHGQTGYAANRLDDAVDGVIRHIFKCMQSIPKSEVVNSGLVVLQQEQESRYKAIQREYAKMADNLSQLKSEVLKAIRGESKFTPELLNELIAESEKALAETLAARDKAKQELDSYKNRLSEMQAKYDEVISWTQLYDAADLAAKKMIVANLINRIVVGTDYDIHIDFNIDLKHFNIQLDCCA